MRLGEGVEWAAHCCTILGTLPPGVALPGHRLAEFHDLPSDYLTKQLQALRRAGIVGSAPGRGGGYCLARPAADITLLDIVLAVDGADRAFRCTQIRQRGPSAVGPEHYVAPCGIARAMWRAEDAWRAELDQRSVADLVAELRTSASPEQAARAIDWMNEALA